MPSYDYKCSTEDCLNKGVVLTIVHRMVEPKPDCAFCSKQLQVHHTAAPVVAYKGDWFSTKGKY